jgi:homogentisate solanesyltransferase
MNYLFCYAICGLICVTASHAFTTPSFEFPISRNINVIGGSHSNHNHRAITINRNIDIRFMPPQRHSLLMSVEGDFDPEAISKAKQEVESGSIKARVRALYKFTRPHTIRGTILASIAGTIRALVDTPGAIGTANWSIMLPRAVVGMTALLLGNAFIVGINQIYDKEIDEMNKPFLPVASGEMSKRTAWIAVVASGVLGPILVKTFFPPLLFQLYCFGIFLGGIYSVPPIRTKKNPILAGLTIATVRGFLLNFGVYYAVKDAIGAPFRWSPKVAFIARFMVAFASVIAVTKDLPDMEGDKVRVVVLIGVVEDFS